MDLTTCIKEMGAAIEAYTERHGEEPNTLYMTARLMARIEAWVLRDGFVQGSYGYKSGFGMMPNGHVEWFSGLAVKLLDGEGLRWAVAREHVISAECRMQSAELMKGEGK